MPAWPGIGSSRSATVLSSIVCAGAAASPNGTERSPGVEGSTPLPAAGSDEKLTTLLVWP